MIRGFLHTATGHIRPVKDFQIPDKIRKGFAMTVEGSPCVIVEVFHRSNSDVDVTARKR